MGGHYRLKYKGGAVGNRGCSAGFHAPAARAYHQSQFHPWPQGFSPGGAVHSASKFALRALSEGLRAELATTPIRSTLITPGAVDTGIQHKTTGSDSARMLEIYKNAISPEAVARTIAFAMEQPANVDINEIVVRPTAVLLTSDVIEELRDRSDELGRRERLLQQDTAWDP
nr:SDR family NAD(P)-dependent oxidoreductase [Bradyrhizobium sp. 76]